MALFNNRKLSPKVYITQTIAHFGTQCIWMMESYFLLFFYTDVIQIPPLAATIFMAIARVWDAINDPMMGVICDKTRSKEGKARFWLKYMSVPAGLCIALTYICPDISVGGRIAWVSVTYLIMGMTSRRTVEICPNDIMNKQACILGSGSADIRHFVQALKFIEAHRGKYPFGELISTEYPLEELNTALHNMLEGKDLKAAIDCRNR